MGVTSFLRELSKGDFRSRRSPCPRAVTIRVSYSSPRSAPRCAMPRTTSPARRAANHRTRIRPSTCSATKIAVRAHPVRGLPAALASPLLHPPSSSSSAVVCALSQNSSSSIHRPLRSFLACLELPSPPPPRASGTSDGYVDVLFGSLRPGTVLPYLSSSRIFHPSLAGRTWSSTASRSIPTNVWGLKPRTTTSFARSSAVPSTGLQCL